MRTSAVVGALVGVLVIAACGGGGSATPTPDYAVLAAAVVDDAPIRLPDLPEGWEMSPTAEDLTARLELSAECNLLNLNVMFPGAAAVDKSGPFNGPLGQQLASYASVYRTTDLAIDEVQAIENLVNRCEDEYKSEFERIAKGQLTEIGIDLSLFADIDVSLEEVEAEPLGDESRVYRFQITVGLPGEDRSFTLNVLVVRVGRLVATVSYMGSGTLNAADERAIGERIVEKMTAANERLAVASDQ